MYTYQICWLPEDPLFGNSNHSPCTVLPNRRGRKLCAFPCFPHGRARAARRPAILEPGALSQMSKITGGSFGHLTKNT